MSKVQLKSEKRSPRLPIGFIGDVHACPVELKIAVTWLVKQGVPRERIFVLGDLEDRGPMPGTCTRLIKELGINSLMGNHELSLLNLAKDRAAGKEVTFKETSRYKEVSLNALTSEDLEVMSKFPRMLHFEDHNIAAVHAGLSSYIPWFKQDHFLDHIQLVHPKKPMESLWWGPKTMVKYAKTETELLVEGWRRWYDTFSHPFDIVFGHSVFESGPLLKLVNGQRIFGIDTGVVFGGYLTAMVLDGLSNPKFAHVKAREIYFTEPDFSYDFSQFKPLGEIL